VSARALGVGARLLETVVQLDEERNARLLSDPRGRPLRDHAGEVGFPADGVAHTPPTQWVQLADDPSTLFGLRFVDPRNKPNPEKEDGYQAEMVLDIVDSDLRVGSTTVLYAEWGC